MGCNCKNEKLSEVIKSVDENIKYDNNNNSTALKIINYTFKTFLFLIVSVLSLPIVVIFTFYVLFKTLVLGDSINMTGAITSIGKALKLNKGNDNNEEDEDLIDEDSEDEYEVYDVDDITVEKKNN
jgi:hypothetical protein